MSKYFNDIKNYFELIKKTLDVFDKNNLEKFIDLLLDIYEKGGNIYIFGNGGSGANASHFTGDFLKGISYPRERGFKAICLNDNIPGLMAYANDLSYDEIFVHELKIFLNPDDLVIGISGSGNSVNIVTALEYAKSKKVKTVAVCGYDGGKIKNIADLILHAEIDNMEVAEDVHLILFHCTKTILMDLMKK